MFVLQPIVDCIDTLIIIVRSGAAKNSAYFPHAEVRKFLNSAAGFDFIYKVLPQDNDYDEAKIYQDLVTSLLVLEPLVKNEAGKKAFSSILNAMKFFLLKMDHLLEEKLKVEGDKIKLEAQISTRTVQLDSILKNLNDSSYFVVEKGKCYLKFFKS